MKRILLFSFIVLGFSLVKPPLALGRDPFVPHPRVTNVSPTSVHPGDTITLTGEEFAHEGKVINSCDKADKTRGTCTWKSVIAAYKTPRTHADYFGSRPDFRLTIISLTTSTIQAKIPDGIPSGDGTYNLGYFLEYNPAEVGQSGANQLVGLARYDIITVTGAGAGTSNNTQKPNPTTPPKPTATPTPTQSEKATTTTTSLDKARKTDQSNTAAQKTVPEKIEIPIPQFVRSIISFFQSLFHPR